MSKQRILIVGGTGMLGEPVARRLADDGYSVRVLSRNLDRARALFADEGKIEVVEGNVTEKESLQKAISGCQGIHINLSGGDMEQRGTKAVCSAAKDISSVQRITLISGTSTCEENTWYPGTRGKLSAEKAIQSSGIEYTIFRCTMFMETLPKWKYLIGEQPTKWHWIASKDYAAMVSKAFVTPTAANKVLFVCGPGPARTLKEALDTIYIPTCDPARKYIPHYSVWYMTIFSWIPGNAELRNKILPKFHWLSKINELGDPTEANELLGSPKISLEQWCNEKNISLNSSSLSN